MDNTAFSRGGEECVTELFTLSTDGLSKDLHIFQTKFSLEMEG